MSYQGSATRRSAVHDNLAALGARWRVVEDWHVAECFTDPMAEARGARESIGIADLSWHGKLDLKGSALDPGALQAKSTDIVSILLLKPGHALAVTRPGTEKSVLASVGRHDIENVHVTDVTSALSMFMIAGRKTRDLLSQLTSLDLRESSFPDRACRQAPLARVHAIIERADFPSLQCYRLFVGRDVGEYVWDTLLAAGAACGIVPCGSAAIDLLRKGT